MTVYKQSIIALEPVFNDCLMVTLDRKSWWKINGVLKYSLMTVYEYWQTTIHKYTLVGHFPWILKCH